jgi:hypothetical protein
MNNGAFVEHDQVAGEAQLLRELFRRRRIACGNRAPLANREATQPRATIRLRHDRGNGARIQASAKKEARCDILWQTFVHRRFELLPVLLHVLSDRPLGVIDRKVPIKSPKAAVAQGAATVHRIVPTTN